MQTAMRRSVGTASTAAARLAARPASVSQSSAIVAARTIATSARTAEEKKSSGLLKSILHGSEKAKAEAPQVPGLDGSASGARGGQHSQMVGRGKYIHELYKHKVKPGKVQEYRKLVEEFYTSLANNPEYDMKLTGSWEVVVGELDTFCGAPSLPHDMLTGNELTMSTSAFVNAIDHVWEHNGFHGLDLLMPKLAADKKYQDFQAKLAPMLNSRTSQLIQEFSFWPSSPPKQLGGVYEMRNYTLKPGTLLEWEQEWRIGLDARKKFVEPIAAFFSQVGELHQVIHMWHYESLDARKQMRQRAWEIDTWSATVAKTVKLADHMSAQILQPLPFSPLR